MTREAAAQDRLRVNVELRNCNELSQPEVRRVLSAELSAHLAEERSSDVTRIIIECNGPRAVLRVGDPLSRKVVQRTIDLGSAEPKARGRLLALATAELVVASWTELETNPNPRVEPAGPRPPAKVRAAARKVVQKRAQRKVSALSPAPPSRAQVPPAEPQRKWESVEPYDERWPDPQNWGIEDPAPITAFRIMGVASARSFFNHEGALWGGGLRIAQERFKRVGWALDALAERGEVQTNIARYQVDTATIGAGINVYYRWKVLVGRVGAGVRMGVAGAQSNDPEGATNSVVAPWGWPLGSLGFGVYGRSGIVVDLTGEAGYVVLPVTAGTPALSGPWFSVQVGVGVIP
jgi:hypothetical protein